MESEIPASAYLPVGTALKFDIPFGRV